MSRKKSLILGLVLIGGCAMNPLRRFEQSLVFQPHVYPDGDYAAGADFEDVWFKSADGTQLHGWFVSPADPQGVLLFCHGNAGNISHRVGAVRDLVDQHQLAVLIFDYRGYGRSEGSPDEPGVIADAKAARKWLAGRANVAESAILVLGQSLGGGVAVQLAADDGAAGLILISTFASLPEVAASHVPFLAPNLIMKNRFQSAKRIAKYHGPVLVSHGDADQVVPYSQGEKLFAAANEPKQFVAVANGGHNDEVTEEFHAAVANMLREMRARK